MVEKIKGNILSNYTVFHFAETEAVIKNNLGWNNLSRYHASDHPPTSFQKHVSMDQTSKLRFALLLLGCFLIDKYKKISLQAGRKTLAYKSLEKRGKAETFRTAIL